MFSVTQNGKPLDPSKYVWDEATKVFGTKESNLVLDFSDYFGVTFNTGDNCTFKTGFNCTFNTGDNCTFKTGWNCTFDTGDNCTFKTDCNCTFNTGSNCTFEVEEKCALTYTWNNCFEVYKLVPKKVVRLLENGFLEDVAPVNPKQKVTLELTEEQLEQVKKTLGI